MIYRVDTQAACLGLVDDARDPKLPSLCLVEVPCYGLISLADKGVM